MNYSPSRQESGLLKFEGPFVHVGDEGANNVVNSPADSLKSPGRYKGISDLENRRKTQTLTASYSSTLSANYDARAPDPRWVCVFCKKSSHFEGLGDLFGPYFVPSGCLSTYYQQLVNSPEGSSPRADLASSFIAGGGGKKKKKRQNSGGKNSPKKESGPSQTEVWFHEDCLVWLPDVSLIGHRIIGLESALSSAETVLCQKCGKNGSTIACIRVGCRDSAHFPCAKSNFWAINEPDFEARCPKHKV